ncbi:unnamed protein product [Cuscuta europaea]|uniref:BPL/LPL catalytic domain-containing protein n=1 Tax=Cuscuta europaea TaxID=41803 RepID=A0A9P0YNR6_CUSEU|nr:unnamed protein product [Cuscuta europaea]
MALFQNTNRQLPLMNLVRLQGVPILEQLCLEERLLRTSSDNWCIINDGTDQPTVVMGVSGKPTELIEVNSVLQDKVPVIKRFTGGGTVIVDHGTIFATFICNKDAVPGVKPYPQPIMSWSSLLYGDVFRGIREFALRENDYVFGSHKFGGNAQSITKSRWIHHTSFLWDYAIHNMAYLKFPKRAPDYRQARGHLDFICSMKEFMSRPEFMGRTIDASRNYFYVRRLELEEVEHSLDMKFTPTSRLLMAEELEGTAIVSHSKTPISQSM